MVSFGLNLQLIQIFCRPGNESVALIPAAAPAESPDDDARLSVLFVTGGNGTVYDLSPSFQADVSQYGAMVGADCKDVTLCFEMLEGQLQLQKLLVAVITVCCQMECHSGSRQCLTLTQHVPCYHWETAAFFCDCDCVQPF